MLAADPISDAQRDVLIGGSGITKLQDFIEHVEASPILSDRLAFVFESERELNTLIWSIDTDPVITVSGTASDLDAWRVPGAGHIYYHGVGVGPRDSRNDGLGQF